MHSGMALRRRAHSFQGQSHPRRYTAPRTRHCSANGTARRGRRTARRIFLVALVVSLHPPNHRRPPTAFGTDNGRSVLAAGTALRVKGFRTPARQGRDGIVGGRRPKSLKGGNRGGICAGIGVGLWGFSAGVCPHLSVSNGDHG